MGPPNSSPNLIKRLDTARRRSPSYCVNCATPIVSPALCATCGLDPGVPVETVQRYVEALRQGTCHPSPSINIVSDGEVASLGLSVLAAAFVLALATPVTYGVVWLGVLWVVISLFLLRVRESRVRMTLPRSTRESNPKLSNLALLCGFRLDIPPPHIYIQPDNEPNAYCAGFWGRYWIVLTTSLLDICTPSELSFIIGHEMGHAKREHTSWLLLISQRRNVILPIIQDALRLVFNRWLLKAEYTADRAGLLACRDISSAVGALVKVQFWGQPINIDNFMADSDMANSDPLTRLGEYFGDHPYLVNRITELTSFHRDLVKRGIL